MTFKVAKVLRGFIKLSSSEKIEMINELNKYQSAGIYEKDRIEKQVEIDVEKSMSVGPKNSICECCGR
jgi:hypothetical protein